MGDQNKRKQSRAKSRFSMVQKDLELSKLMSNKIYKLLCVPPVMEVVLRTFSTNSTMSKHPLQ